MCLTDKLNLNIALISQNECYLYKDEDTRSHLSYDPLHIPIPETKKYMGENIYQINLFCEDKYLDIYKKETKDVTYSRLDNYGYDIYAINQTKATGIKHLIDHLGIDQKDTIAFGDGHNDASMVRYAGIGVAMENAVQDLKDIADEITLSNEEDGIAVSLYKHMPEIC